MMSFVLSFVCVCYLVHEFTFHDLVYIVRRFTRIFANKYYAHYCRMPRTQAEVEKAMELCTKHSSTYYITATAKHCHSTAHHITATARQQVGNSTA